MHEIDILKTKRFDSEVQFKEFEEKINALVLSNKLTFIDTENFRNINFQRYKDIENNIYCLSEPDLYWRGFFLNYNETITFIKKIRKLDKQKGLGCGTIFFILILIILASILFK